ncbi:MAG TPA: S8 family serine peptidase, partial [Bryobacteraceae bacterium]|nr:S8 family serine peptidase [Bryobacteraceae bacterium]
GSFSEIHPSSSSLACDDPGVVSGDHSLEAIIDAQWASAAAPNANIVLASCASTSQFGGFIAMQNLLDSAAPPAIISISFGAAEDQLGDAENAFIKALYQQAVAEGVSVFAATGDSGADGNIDDRAAGVATHGISASGFASTIYNVAVGGTDYADAFLGETDQYWNATNSPFLGSAKSYIPEIPWNATCAGSLVANYLGFATAYGPNGLCNSSVASQNALLSVAAGSGAPSAVYAKPAWQNVFGNPADQVRDLPDVSLFASTGPWGHFYAFCMSSQGQPCAQGSFYGVGGTSLSSPIMAGIQALINQKTGARSGNPNPNFYALARKEYGASGNESCNSSLGISVGTNCVFHDVTLGDNDVLCRGTTNCFTDGATNGVLSRSSTSFEPAYPAHPGWDFATGLGTVNAYKLVMSWPASPSISASARR